jgi:hypothetical protein
MSCVIPTRESQNNGIAHNTGIDIPIQTKTGRVYHGVQTKIQITYGKMTFLSVMEWQII